MLRRALIYSVQEGLLTLWRNKLISLLSIATIAVSFAVLGVFLLIAVNIEALAETYGDALLTHVFLKDGLDAAQRDSLLRRLEADERVDHVQFVDQEQAAKRFSELFPDDADLLGDLEENYLPASFEVYLVPRTGTKHDWIDAFVAEIRRMDGVESVLYDRRWIDTLENTSRWFGYAGLVLGGMLILAAIATASNIIKLNVLSRREEIEIMRLVGAEGVYVRGPFFVGGVIQGLMASVLAIALLFAVYNFGRIFLESAGIELLKNLQYRFLPLWQLLLFVAGGLGVGVLASLLSFGRATRI